MTVEVLLFARLRELAGTHSVSVSIPTPATARTVWSELCRTHPRLAGADAGLRVALNQSYAAWDSPVAPGDTLAFIPPVAGGAPSTIHITLTPDPLDARALESLVRTDADGAVCTFTGVVRNHADGHPVTHIDYEAYPGMAESQMEAIATDTLARFPITAIAIAHRTGTLQVGDASIVIAVSAPHRAPAFHACHHLMDTIKAHVPIWKKEHGPDGTTWVDDSLRSR